jgi:excinuclease ABC subunit C
MSGTDVVASMVVFTNGVSNKGEYRKFKTKKDHNNDFYNMHETIKRRFSEKNVKAWGKPDLVLIDGGKGQLDAAIRARDEMGYPQVPFVGLAKREEQIVIKKSHEQLAALPSAADGLDDASVVAEQGEEYKTKAGRVIMGDPDGSNVTLDKSVLQTLGGFVSESDDFILTNVPHSTNVVKLLQRIRDESHRFAVSYHSVLKQKRQIASVLDDIPTIGPSTRKKLLKTFGSVRGVMQARDFELEKVLGQKKTVILKQYLRPFKKEQKQAAEENRG